VDDGVREPSCLRDVPLGRLVGVLGPLGGGDLRAFLLAVGGAAERGVLELGAPGLAVHGARPRGGLQRDGDEEQRRHEDDHLPAGHFLLLLVQVLNVLWLMG
jgi:hypothetical protein